MARGWESKSVEDQVQQSEAAPAKETKEKGRQKTPLTPAQVEAHRRREVLILSRVRVQQNLKASGNPRYTDQLNRALADIEAQLAALESEDKE
ncbi:MAG TPA: hypothetical protein VMB02_05945 [Candidatus Aquilonibacter sp.]|nr:hypothetical protein [Candidatus Aquilonibacter sp.]